MPEYNQLLLALVLLSFGLTQPPTAKARTCPVMSECAWTVQVIQESFAREGHHAIMRALGCPAYIPSLSSAHWVGCGANAHSHWPGCVHGRVQACP